MKKKIEILFFFFFVFRDIFNTLIDLRWRWCIFVFSMAFFVSWLFFAIIYYIIATIHGDFHHLDDENWKPCIKNVNSFTSVFLFSVETQHTIGMSLKIQDKSFHEKSPSVFLFSCKLLPYKMLLLWEFSLVIKILKNSLHVI